MHLVPDHHRQITNCIVLLLLLSAVFQLSSCAQSSWSRPEFANNAVTTNFQANWAWFSRLYDKADLVLEYYCQVYSNNSHDVYVRFKPSCGDQVFWSSNVDTLPAAVPGKNECGRALAVVIVLDDWSTNCGSLEEKASNIRNYLKAQGFRRVVITLRTQIRWLEMFPKGWPSQAELEQNRNPETELESDLKYENMEPDLMDTNRLTKAGQREYSFFNGMARDMAHGERLVALQKQAGILMEINYDSAVKIIHADALNIKTNTVVPIFDLNRIMRHAKRSKMIPMAVVILPWGFSGFDLLPYLDAALLKNGVKLRVYEQHTDWGWFAIQSSQSAIAFPWVVDPTE